LSEGFLSYPVFNGDMSDLRFLDPKGHVIALCAKGTLATINRALFATKSNKTANQPRMQFAP
jgi:hypothetical protein